MLILTYCLTTKEAALKRILKYLSEALLGLVLSIPPGQKLASFMS